jgi:signal transduction histidine kinase
VAAQRRAAEQERRRERSRIARDMHDSLGRRLSLASVQAAQLEVSDLPASQREAVARLATAVRGSVTELHDILGPLRGQREPAHGMAAAGALIEEFRTAGAAVSVVSRGTPCPLPPAADGAAYRVLEEGLTNAVRHAPGQPVSLTADWEAGALVLTVGNATDGPAYAPGSGLADLQARLRLAGGVLGHDLSGGRFRLHATLPAAAGPRRRGRPGGRALGLATGIMLLVILPVTVVLGAR